MLASLHRVFISMAGMSMLACWLCLQPQLGRSEVVSNASPKPSSSVQAKTYQLWPLLPGETLQGLAMQLYPQSPILQERFVHKSIVLSRNFAGQDQGLKLTADTAFSHPQLIAVPNEQAVMVLTQRIKKAEEILQGSQTQGHSAQQRLSLSFNLGMPANSTLPSGAQTPAKPQEATKPQQLTQPEEANMPKIVFDEPAPEDSALEESASDAQLPINTSASSKKPAQALNVSNANKSTATPTPVLQENSQSALHAMFHNASAHLRGHLLAFKQGNLNDWLRHPQLKWVCLEVLVLGLLLLYALVDRQLQKRSNKANRT